MIRRRTIYNLITFIKEKRFKEIFLILRRRIINTLKFIRNVLFGIFRIIYNNPSVLRHRRKWLLSKILRKYFNITTSPKEKSRIKIGVVVRNGDMHPQSSAFIRLIAPLTHPKLNDYINLDIYPGNTTKLFPGTQLCIVQRTAYDSLQQAEQLIIFLKKNNIPLVVDTDDAFHSLDESHPEYDIHQKRLAAKDLLLSATDEIWVSTANLIPTLNLFKNKCYVIENTIDKRIWSLLTSPDIQTLNQSRPLRLLYMGTATHDQDLNMILPVLIKLSKEYPSQFTLTLVGVTLDVPDYPWIKKISPKSSLYPLFVNWFQKQAHNFDIGLSPLINNPFNQSKSDIKCLDYLAAGILPVVSDITPYKNKDLDDFIIRVENSPEDWHKELSKLILNRETVRQTKPTTIKSARKYILNKREAGFAAEKICRRIENLLK